MMNELPFEQQLYRTFCESKRESLRLDAALEGFFLDIPQPSDIKDEYLHYLTRRIRAAMERLISENNIEKMQLLESLGCFGEKELPHFIEIARKSEKLPALMWLLQLKDQKYHYAQRDFSL